MLAKGLEAARQDRPGPGRVRMGLRQLGGEGRGLRGAALVEQLPDLGKSRRRIGR